MCRGQHSADVQVIDSLHGDCFPLDVTTAHKSCLCVCTFAIFRPADMEVISHVFKVSVGGCNLWMVYVYVYVFALSSQTSDIFVTLSTQRLHPGNCGDLGCVIIMAAIVRLSSVCRRGVKREYFCLISNFLAFFEYMCTYFKETV